MIETRCKARQYSDQMHCNACNLTWDMNDSDPPPCKVATDRVSADDIARHAVENNAYARAKMRRHG